MNLSHHYDSLSTGVILILESHGRAKGRILEMIVLKNVFQYWPFRTR